MRPSSGEGDLNPPGDLPPVLCFSIQADAEADATPLLIFFLPYLYGAERRGFTTTDRFSGEILSGGGEVGEGTGEVHLLGLCDAKMFHGFF